MATAIRQPFGELGTPRLQQLQNVKNRQNAITTSHSAPAKSTFTFNSPMKRQHSPTLPAKDSIGVFDDNDSENIDPSIFLSPSKRAKNDHGLPTKKPHPSFSLNVTPKPSSSTRPISTPRSTPLRGSTPPPGTRMTAPAGRSPQRQRIGLLSKNRRISAPIKRIDPPAFSPTRTTKSSPALPFSIDAALNGSLSTSSSSSKPQPRDALSSHPVVASDRKPMPQSWFFPIYEDSAEEEATNLMEHSACALDISDDDEAGAAGKTAEDVKGKENVPPPDWVAAQPRMGHSSVEAEVEELLKPRGRGSRQAQLAKALKRTEVSEDAMAVDAPPRSPLSDLAPEDFYAEGLDKDSVAVEAEGEENKGRVLDLVAAAAAAETEGRDHASVELEHAVENKNDILVYESDGAKET